MVLESVYNFSFLKNGWFSHEPFNLSQFFKSL